MHMSGIFRQKRKKKIPRLTFCNVNVQHLHRIFFTSYHTAQHVRDIKQENPYAAPVAQRRAEAFSHKVTGGLQKPLATLADARFLAFFFFGHAGKHHSC